MDSAWNSQQAEAFVQQFAPTAGSDLLALRTYASRLLGLEKKLVLKGGGNTSVKGEWTDLLGKTLPVVYVKASGCDLATMMPDDHVPLDLAWLQQLESLPHLTDDDMLQALHTHVLRGGAALPSIEALVHAFLPHTWVDHTHPAAILTLTNQENGEELVRQALGDEVVILPYVKPGFALARAVITAWRAAPTARAMVLMQHGLLTWGASARESYEATLLWVSRAEAFLQRRSPGRLTVTSPVREDEARERYAQLAPVLRGALCQAAGSEEDGPRLVLKPLIRSDILELLQRPEGLAAARTAPLTSDYLIRTKPLPMVIEGDQPLAEAVQGYAQAYRQYLERNRHQWYPGMAFMDAAPRVVLMPGVGAVCAGRDEAEAQLVLEITAQSLAAKAAILDMGGLHQGLADADLFAMEYFSRQQAKLTRQQALLAGRVALVTGAGGAIGAGICRGLLANGCHVAATDVDANLLTSLVHDLSQAHPGRVMGVLMDVTQAFGVAEAYRQVIMTWGGLDLLVLNAGVAHVSTLEQMHHETFQRLERINIEGTLLPLSQVAGLFRRQGVGGDVVLISTKNVFAPGAGFGAYSATKAAAHQLARIASLELAEIDVRVNMVAPDAVFADGSRRSGLWAEVGPDRMKARGLDEQGLEEYYRKRNLLKSRVTADHVARAVLFFASRQTPTTGATLPVDGGLPDATPR